MKPIFLTLFFSCFLIFGYSQSNLLSKRQEEVKQYFKDAKFKLIESSNDEGVLYDKFDCGENIQTVCYYSKDNKCWMVREIMPIKILAQIKKELNYSCVAVKNKPNIWTTLKGDTKIELFMFYKQQKMALDYTHVLFF
jgi:hypothetical protein